MATKQQRSAGRRVRLFKNGRSQAVRIPREWELPGSEVMIRKDGDRLILTPPPKSTLIATLKRLKPLPKKDRMPSIDDFPPESIEPIEL